MDLDRHIRLCNRLSHLRLRKDVLLQPPAWLAVVVVKVQQHQPPLFGRQLARLPEIGKPGNQLRRLPHPGRQPQAQQR
jgi:hypothetical protein